MDDWNIKDWSETFFQLQGVANIGSIFDIYSSSERDSKNAIFSDKDFAETIFQLSRP